MPGGGDRRRRELGPPEREPERRTGATRGLKMACPFCGCSESSIERSKGLITKADRVRRRRQCVECGRRFPTTERVDYELLELELGAEVETGVLDPPPRTTWDHAERLLHALWGAAKDGDYRRATKRKFEHLQQVLAGLRRTA